MDDTRPFRARCSVSWALIGSAFAASVYDARKRHVFSTRFPVTDRGLRSETPRFYLCLITLTELVLVVTTNMSPKRSAPSTTSGQEPKRQRKMLTISEKITLLNMLDEGKSYAEVGRHYNLNESTIRYIKKDEKKIRTTAAMSFSHTAKRVLTSRNKGIVRMEAALALWVTDCRKKNIPLDSNMIRTKAMKLYAMFDEGGDDVDPEAGPSTSSATQPIKFRASKGWFEKFQKRYNIRNVTLHGEAASADKVAADDYVNDTFKTIIEEGGYRAEQVFNMDETGLFWKRMPSRTFLMKDEAKARGVKSLKDRITLVMCGNAEGFMIKPGVIFRSQNPRALKNKNKNLLPVYWMSNPTAWITKALTSDWFYQCFIPEVKLYLAEKGLDFKVLLLLDNVNAHKVDLSYEGVKIEFLLPNTTSLIQPMDQGIIRAFKALYVRNTLQHLVEAMDSEENFALKTYWGRYTIATCLQNIQKAINEMKAATLNACWYELWPEAVHYYKGFSPDEIHHSAVNKTVKLAKLLGGEGFIDMTPQDVTELVETQSNPLTDEDLTEMTQVQSEEEDSEDDPGEKQDEGLSLERLATIVRTSKELQKMVDEWDPQMIRALKFKNAIDGATEAYRSLLNHLKRQHQQLPITMFITRMKKEEAPTPSEETKSGDDGDKDTPPPDEAAVTAAPSEEM